MKAVIQRVQKASVEVDSKVIGKIDLGFLVLLGVEEEDTIKDLDYILKKVTSLRIFSDSDNKMNLNLSQVNGSILLVSQFTLLASTRKGNRPSFNLAANPKKANEYYNLMIKKLKEANFNVETGEFGAEMQVSLINDGPVTILLNSFDQKIPRKVQN